MILKSCTNCEYGAIKENRSYCRSEACYSHLTTCIQKKALAAFLEQERIVEKNKYEMSYEIRPN